MHRMKWVAAIFGLLLMPAMATAQSSGAISGVVKDATGGVLPGVAVEAASPALIEKVRTVVTDGEGRYQVVDLRPGTYSVTFTLAGFATVKREGIQLTTGFTATVDGQMKVGDVAETITVAGATPVVARTPNCEPLTVPSITPPCCVTKTLPAPVKSVKAWTTARPAAPLSVPPLIVT